MSATECCRSGAVHQTRLSSPCCCHGQTCRFPLRTVQEKQDRHPEIHASVEGSQFMPGRCSRHGTCCTLSRMRLHATLHSTMKTRWYRTHVLSEEILWLGTRTKHAGTSPCDACLEVTPAEGDVKRLRSPEPIRTDSRSKANDFHGRVFQTLTPFRQPVYAHRELKC